MDDLGTPAKRLRWARDNKTNYSTGTDAARAFGWTVSTYLGHENGDRSPSVKAAKRYAAAYKVPWAWILDGGPLPAPDNQPTPREKTQRVFISHAAGDPLPKELIDLLVKLPEGSAEERTVISMLRRLKMGRGDK
jgi:transcriptional regulator with XRE-family HTH domain